MKSVASELQFKTIDQDCIAMQRVFSEVYRRNYAKIHGMLSGIVREDIYTDMKFTVVLYDRVVVARSGYMDNVSKCTTSKEMKFSKIKPGA